MTNIEQLKKETDEIKKGLDELKSNVSLSETEKKNKAEALKTQVETTKQKIQAEIDALKDKTDDESKKEKEQAETLLASFNETMNLYASILNSTETKPTEEKEEKTEEEKGFFGKTKDWVGDQRNDVWDKEKWKEETGKNLLRTTGFVATGVGAVALAYKGIKKLWNWAFGDKKEESDEEETETKPKKKKKKSDGESSWRKKFLIGAGITTGTVIGGVEIYKHRNRISSWAKEKLGLSLPFDEARKKVEAEVRNGKIDDDHFGVFNANFEGGITYDEKTQEICSYGQKTKIEKSGKKLQGMDVEFASWEELIHAANIVNFAKRKLRGRGVSATPFCQTSWGGDIAFNCSANGKKEFLSASNSNEWSWILGTVGTVGGGILGGYCAGVKGAAIGTLGGGVGGYALGAYIDNTSTAGSCCETIARGANFDKFINYLNNQTDENGESLWEAGKEEHIDPNGTPINGLVDNGKEGSEWDGILAELEQAYGEDQSGRRNLKIEWDESKPEEYRISSYGHELKMTIKGGPTKKGEKIDCNKITKIHIEKYDKLNGKKIDCRGDGLDIDFPHSEAGLKEAIRVANLTNMIVEDRRGKGGETYPFAYGRYKTPFNLDMDTDGLGGEAIVTHGTLKEKFPTIFEDLSNYPYVRGLFGVQEEMHNQAVQDKSKGSQYIKFLHQIGKGRFWKKVD